MPPAYRAASKRANDPSIIITPHPIIHKPSLFYFYLSGVSYQIATRMLFRFASHYKTHVKPYESLATSGGPFNLVYDGPEPSPIAEYVVKVRQCRREADGAVIEDIENGCLSLPYIVHSEPRTREERDLKSWDHKPPYFIFHDLNFGDEASGKSWVLKFELAVRTETLNGLENLFMAELHSEDIYVTYSSKEEARLFAPNYCGVCKVEPCKLYLQERLPKRRT